MATPSRSSSFAGTSDRYIPNRAATNRDAILYNMMAENNTDSMDVELPNKGYKESVAESLFGEEVVEDHKILALKNKAPAPRPGYQNHLKVLYSQNASKPKKEATAPRSIRTNAERVLDAPGLVDDYYLNLLDWNANNVLAIALGNSVFLWDATTSSITELMSADNHVVTSVSFCPGSSQYLAVGLDDAQVQIWNVEQSKNLRTIQEHQGRVGALAWNGHVLSSGSFDSQIINCDVRAASPVISTFAKHEGEVCGLKWSLDGTNLASGGNDNQLNIWGMAQPMPLFSLNDHQAAVKALAWCPWQHNLLASGGGSADRTIKFWNTHTGALLNSIDTESQVCSLMWSKHQKEIVSSHGFSKNQLCVWKYPSMVKMAELTGHTSRVLHMAMNPDGTTVVTAGADETLRFWRAFEPKIEASKKVSPATTVASNKNKPAPAMAPRGIRSSMNTIR